jgi:Dockerin type I domain
LSEKFRPHFCGKQKEIDITHIWPASFNQFRANPVIRLQTGTGLLFEKSLFVILVIVCCVTTSWAQTPTPTATATPPLCELFIPPVPDMVGTVYYCSNAPMPGVTVTIHTFCSTAAHSTDSSGQYRLVVPYCKTGISGYATCSKADQIPGSPGINTVDVVAVQRHFLIIGPPLSGCRLTAADVNGDGSVNTTDVIAIQRFFLGLSTGIANVGKYQFTPPYRCYTDGFPPTPDFNAIIFGDVATPFIY